MWNCMLGISNALSSDVDDIIFWLRVEESFATYFPVLKNRTGHQFWIQQRDTAQL